MCTGAGLPPSQLSPPPPGINPLAGLCTPGRQSAEHRFVPWALPPWLGSVALAHACWLRASPRCGNARWSLGPVPLWGGCCLLTPTVCSAVGSALHPARAPAGAPPASLFSCFSCLQAPVGGINHVHPHLAVHPPDAGSRGPSLSQVPERFRLEGPDVADACPVHPEALGGGVPSQLSSSPPRPVISNVTTETTRPSSARLSCRPSRAPAPAPRASAALSTCP